MSCYLQAGVVVQHEAAALRLLQIIYYDDTNQQLVRRTTHSNGSRGSLRRRLGLGRGPLGGDSGSGSQREQLLHGLL